MKLKIITSSLVLTSFLLVAGNAMADNKKLSVTHGVASGDVTSTSAVIWSRSSDKGYMHVRIDGPEHGEGKHGKHVKQVLVTATNDYTGKIKFEGLDTGKEYHYNVWFTKDKDNRHAENVATGEFTTAPKANEAEPVTFAWGGDVAGQNVCRDAKEGFPIFNAVNDYELDFFIGLGDMIYADGVCAETGRYGNAQVVGDFSPSADLNNFWAHWKYNRDDNAYRKLLSKTPYVAIWDDHEVVNDFGPLTDTRDAAPYTAGEHLLPTGLQAFLDYNPIAESNLNPKRLYRNIRWGKHLELIVLDNRQYRDANLEEDDDTLVKTMLGREQLTWLKETVEKSDATWKVIVSSVPVSIPTGFPAKNGRDGWADFDQVSGFERELIDILKMMHEKGERNVLFITTDVHFGEVFRYTPFEEDPEFKVHEVVTGPMNAGLFPNRDYDTTLNTESLFFYGPESFDTVTTYEDARPWMNFGTASIDSVGNMTFSVVNVDGDVVYTSTLAPQ